MLVDTHTHLNFPAFATDLAEVLARAAAHGVERMVVVGTDLPSSRRAVELAASRPGQLWATVGVHPHETADFGPDHLAELRELAACPGVVAIGETGLDFYRDRSPRPAQQAAFAAQQALARELGRPLIIHSRAALDECYDSLRRHGGFEGPVVMHCFTTAPEQVERFLEAGCYIGMDGPVTFPRAADARAVVERVPLERLVLETDCPYLAPQGYRGRRGEPWQVALVAAKVAEVRQRPVAEVIDRTGRNAAELFGWDGT